MSNHDEPRTTPSAAGKGPQPRAYSTTAFETGYQRIKGFRQNAPPPVWVCPYCGTPDCMENHYDMDDNDAQGDNYSPKP